jgi:tRNA wybutosine-synthesizing protein 1
LSLPEELLGTYRKHKYSIVGQYGAVKTCHWERRSLNTSGEEHCYKQRFYGVPCHRCLQMTPSLGHCLQSCVFCWRTTPEALGVHWEQTRLHGRQVDDPDALVDGCLEAHRRALLGFKGNPNVEERMLKEAMKPIHAAISLEGEPTLYPHLGDLVEAFYGRGFRTVFIVTNGLNPEALSGLSTEPSQLYVSVSAPDEETYERTCRPLVPDAWNRLMETMDVLRSFSCPTVLRHTLVPKINMNDPAGYAKFAEKSDVTYIEPKAAMSVGYARQRFGYDEMAWHSEIQEFAEALAQESGYTVIDEQPLSSIVLLSRLAKAKKLY